MEYKLLSRLDKVLILLSQRTSGSYTVTEIYDDLYPLEFDNEVDLAQLENANFVSPDYAETRLILKKLSKDTYTLFYKGDLDNDRYQISFEGLVFLEQGGYIGKQNEIDIKIKAQRSEFEVNKTIQSVIAATGIIASVYYILEILGDTNGINSLFLGAVCIAFLGVYLFARKFLSQILLSLLFLFLFVSLIYIIRLIVPKDAFYIPQGRGLGHPNFVPTKVPPMPP